MGANAPLSGNVTERQQRWFATVRANFEAKSGRRLADWAAIARSCPHATPRGRVDWLRAEYGLGVNHAALVLSEAFPDSGGDEPEAIRAALWKDAGSRAILEAVEAIAAASDALVIGHRKSFTSFSRAVQFAAMRPLKGGRALIGFRLVPAASPRLAAPARRESWSERLTATVELDDARAVDDELARIFAAAAVNGRHSPSK
jgi:hypothetical protein